MSEELIQRNLIEAPEKMGDWNFYNIGATTLKALKGAKIIPDKDYEAYPLRPLLLSGIVAGRAVWRRLSSRYTWQVYR